MKTLFILALLLTSVGSSAQSVVRKDNTFKLVTKASKFKVDTLITAYRFEDANGNTYPIIINRHTGRCYVWRRSSKTGKSYKSYMDSKVSQAICKELGITYKLNK